MIVTHYHKKKLKKKNLWRNVYINSLESVCNFLWYGYSKIFKHLPISECSGSSLTLFYFVAIIANSPILGG